MIYLKTANFLPEIRENSENGGVSRVLWEQEVPGSNPGAPIDVTN